MARLAQVHEKGCRQCTLADGRPAYMRITRPRLRQSEIDAQRAWRASDVREKRGGV